MKVIGASERNLRALRNALTITGDKSTYGSVKPEMKLKEEKNENVEIAFPFKLRIVKDASGTFLEILPGRLNIDTYYAQRLHIEFTGDNKINLNVIDKDGEYVVVLFTDYLGNGEFRPQITFLNASDTAAVIPWTRGIFSAGLGSIERKTANEVTSFTVKTQRIYSDISESFSPYDHPFSVTGRFKTSIHGQLIKSMTADDFQIYVNPGLVAKKDGVTLLNGMTSDLKGDSTFVIVNDWADKLPTLSVSESSDKFGDELGNYFYHVARIYFTNGHFEIQQQIFDTIFLMGEDTFKVKINPSDVEGFLAEKFIFDDELDKEAYDKSNISLIYKETTISSEDGEQKTALQLKPVFSWKEIENFDDNQDQILSHDGSNLIWSLASPGGKMSVSGTLEYNFSFTYDSESKRTFLYWEPEHDENRPRKGYFLGQDRNTGGFAKWAIDSSDASDGILFWNYGEARPYSTTPPNYSEESPLGYVLAGTAETGFEWLPYLTTTAELSGIGMIRINEEDDKLDYISNKLMSNDESIYIEDMGNSLSLTINEEAFTSSDGSIEINYSNGVFDLITSGGICSGLIRLSEEDSLDYLPNKLVVDESLSGLVKMDVVEGQLKMSLNMSGNGVLLVKNGKIEPLQSVENSVLGTNELGELIWIPFAKCEDA